MSTATTEVSRGVTAFAKTVNKEVMTSHLSIPNISSKCCLNWNPVDRIPDLQSIVFRPNMFF